ncbi:molecular chaperone GrpE [Lusitaniella coriacea LEGE 07157]|uniref:Molecular chaperone GrpE n=1 Tax=Lusitaniella coriacea LEGE 07157 TaxID=945747 RepID=A0A8J7DVC0_9CYAN|nr:molecular chaperone GrpE [Lusitaniella coriacea]MBE9115719.1 molecular chaperone GrpE [Lusitaniella coriacea LEGE 07157]
MLGDPELFWFGVFLWFGVTALLFYFWSDRARSAIAPETGTAQDIEQLKQQCDRLRAELQQQLLQQESDFQQRSFEELQSLAIGLPTARAMVEAKPELPAKNLLPLFTSLGNLLQSWEYETIGEAWQPLNYDPQWHQPDEEDIEPGELVYVRFIGYRSRDRVLCPAKVSRTLPKVQSDER